MDIGEEFPSSNRYSVKVQSSRIDHSNFFACCMFLAEVDYKGCKWQIQFSQKDIIRLYLNLNIECILSLQSFPKCIPWQLCLEKPAAIRSRDIDIIYQYLSYITNDKFLQNTEAIQSFLEIGPKRSQPEFGESFIEGYIHMLLPLESSISRKFSNPKLRRLFTYLHHWSLNIGFFACLAFIAIPLTLTIDTYVAYFHDPNDIRFPSRKSKEGNLLSAFIGCFMSLWILIFATVYFHGRLGSEIRWVVIKKSFIAMYKKRSNRYPSEVFDLKQGIRLSRGDSRNCIPWIPNMVTISSSTWLLQLDTGVYFSRALFCPVFIAAVCMMRFVVPFFNGVGYNQGNPQYFNATPVAEPQQFTCGIQFIAPSDLHIFRHQTDISILKLDKHGIWKMDKCDEVFFPIPLSTFSFFFGYVSQGSRVGIVRNPEKVRYTTNVTKMKLWKDAEVEISGLKSKDILTSDFEATSNMCIIDVPMEEVNNYTYILSFSHYCMIAVFYCAIMTSTNSVISYMGLTHSKLKRDIWFRALHRVREHETKTNRFNSFSPQRNETEHHTGLSWHIDGEETYRAMYLALTQAKHQIFIAGWWLCPDVPLLRPGNLNKSSYLHDLLYQKASEGVLIYILLYREVRLALTLNSSYSKRKIKRHKNIYVIRHPNFQLKDLGFWSHHEKIVVIDQSIAFLGGLDICLGRYDTKDHSLTDSLDDREKLWIGKDYSNPRVKDFIDVSNPNTDLINRSSIPRMPWHDIHCSVSGTPAIDVSYHFIQRWNYIVSKRHFRLRTGWCICCRRYRKRFLPHYILPFDPLVFQPNQTYGIEISSILQHRSCKCQVIRSISLWSAGVPTENSIQNAMMDQIYSSKHYVYIENQFFISGLNSNRSVNNRILQALYNRICRASKENQNYRVYVVMPLLPAFEAKVESHVLSNMHAVMHWQYETISRGNESLFSKLLEEGIDPHDYIVFFGLRTHSVMPDGKLTTEQIYVHSKVCISDDRFVVIGSANLNDRSLNGDRDSEIALLVEDSTLTKGILGGKETNVGELALELRLKLFQEHLGVSLDVMKLFFVDIASPRSWGKIKQIAKSNSQIYDQVFNCAPANYMQEFRYFHSESQPTDIYENQRYRQGNWSSEYLLENDYFPWTDINGVPLERLSFSLQNYSINRVSKVFPIDHYGWAYAKDFKTFQEVRNKKKHQMQSNFQLALSGLLNKHVRRRHWVLPNKNSPISSPQSCQLNEIDECEIDFFEDDTQKIEVSKPLWHSLSKKWHSFTSASMDRFDQLGVSLTTPFERYSDTRITTSESNWDDWHPGSEELKNVTTMASIENRSSGKDKGSLDLSEIQGHLVEFPLDFLCKESLKSSILPKDLYI